jgi:hypothetical protein
MRGHPSVGALLGTFCDDPRRLGIEGQNRQARFAIVFLLKYFECSAF